VKGGGGGVREGGGVSSDGVFGRWVGCVSEGDPAKGAGEKREGGPGKQ